MREKKPISDWTELRKCNDNAKSLTVHRYSIRLGVNTRRIAHGDVWFWMNESGELKSLKTFEMIVRPSKLDSWGY